MLVAVILIKLKTNVLPLIVNLQMGHDMTKGSLPYGYDNQKLTNVKSVMYNLFRPFLENLKQLSSILTNI